MAFTGRSVSAELCRVKSYKSKWEMYRGTLMLLITSVALLASVANSSSTAQDSIPKCWTRLHWAALTGTAMQIKYLIAGGHEVNQITDNDAARAQARVLREEAIAEMGKALLELQFNQITDNDAARAKARASREEDEAIAEMVGKFILNLQFAKMKHESQDDYDTRISSEWKEMRFGSKRKLLPPKEVSGTYLTIMARYHKVLTGDTLTELVKKWGVYEKCIEEDALNQQACSRRQRDDTSTDFQLSVPIPIPPMNVATNTYEEFIAVSLAQNQLDRYQQCLKLQQSESICAKEKPPPSIPWKEFNAREKDMPSYQATPYGALALAKADDAIRQADRDHKATALQLAAASGDVAKVEMLLRHDAWVNNQAEDGSTALHRAAEVDAVYAVQALIDAGAILEAKNLQGYTPLHVAVSHQASRSVTKLLNAGADPNAVTKNRETPMWFALLWGWYGWKIQNILEQFNGQCGFLCRGLDLPPNTIDSYPTPPIHNPIQ